MNGFFRFKYFLSKWDELAEQSATSPNVAEHVLNNNGRTIFFMLQALCRIYKNRGNKKRFEKYNDKFKKIEDLLGDMDHFGYYKNEFARDSRMPPQGLSYYEDGYRSACEQLNAVLLNKDWLNGNRTYKMRKRLSEIKWDKPKKDAAFVEEFYRSEIAEWVSFHKSVSPFTHLEDHLHEYRRKIRWFSIYPHAMRGSIQLIADKETDENTLPYLTEEILNSPYNRFPTGDYESPTLFLNRSRFLALSYLIDKLGDLKDEGMMIEELENTYKRLGINEVEGLAGRKKEILEESSDVAGKFFKEAHLQRLIYGVKKQKAL